MDEKKGNTRRWEDLPIRRDRSPNELNDVLQLFEAGLHLNHSMNNSDPELFRTEFGNINGGGSPTSFSSPILGMKNPNLSGALEANIGPLVTLIGELDLITYSSCEGHSIAGEFYEGYVGVVFLEQPSVQIDRLVGEAGYEGFIAYDLSPKFPPALRGVLGVKSLALGGHFVHHLSLQEFHRGEVAQG